MDSAAVFLFHLFLKDQTWSRSHAEEIKRHLGPFPASAASNARNIVKEIVRYIPEDWNYDAEEDLSHKPVKEFGHNIIFKFAESQEGKQSSNGYDSLSDDESRKPELMSGLLHTAHSQAADSVPSQTKQLAAEATIPSYGGSKYTGQWLKKQCQSCCKKSSGGLEWEALYSAVFDLLSSCQENPGIENNVCV